MTTSITILSLIDLVLITGLVILWRRLQDLVVGGREDDIRIEEMVEIRESLDKLLSEAVRVSIELSDSAEKSKLELSTVISQLDRKLNLITDSIDSQRSPGTQNSDSAEDSVQEPEDRYVNVLRLEKMGLSPAQISEKVGIPVGEIELVLNLRK